MNIKFVFLAATVITIFASGSVLMSLVSTGTRAVNQEVSDEADRYAGLFWGTTLFLVVLSVAVVVLMGSKRAPF